MEIDIKSGPANGKLERKEMNSEAHAPHWMPEWGRMLVLIANVGQVHPCRSSPAYSTNSSLMLLGDALVHVFEEFTEGYSEALRKG